MFVRKDRDGNLVAVGSVDHNRLTQLQGKAKKDSAKAKAESKTSSAESTPVESTPAADEQKPEPEPTPEPVADKPKGAAKSQPTASKLP